MFVDYVAVLVIALILLVRIGLKGMEISMAISKTTIPISWRSCHGSI
ncbi:MAG: hypothetical protein J6H18_04540 [Lachnospiraceae bacterium]|nr:hypothetical protein [Lachnospiraceae bacterium]